MSPAHITDGYNVMDGSHYRSITFCTQDDAAVIVVPNKNVWQCYGAMSMTSKHEITVNHVSSQLYFLKILLSKSLKRTGIIEKEAVNCSRRRRSKLSGLV